MKNQYQCIWLMLMCFMSQQISAQSASETALVSDYQNVVNKAHSTYMRPDGGAANQKIHQWSTSIEAAGNFSSYQWELIPATTEGYYYFKNKSTGKIHKPTGESMEDSSLDGSFDLDETTKDNDFFMYAVEPVVSSGNIADEGYFWIKNKGNQRYVRPNGGGGPVDDGIGGTTYNTIQLRHQSATTPIDGPNSYRWSFVPRTEAGTLPANVWDGTAWSNIVAPRYNNAQINGAYSLSSSGSLNVNNLGIAAEAILTIESGQTLVVNGNLTNDGSVIIESGGSLITNGAITGTGFTIKRNTTFGSSDGQYSVVGSPVTAATTSSLGSIVYTYDETIPYIGNQERFNLVASPMSMTPGEGYFSANSGEVTFTGTPNSGNIDLTMVYSSENDAENAGYNLISNPYPAAISFDAFMATNLTTNQVISGSVYLWDDGGSDNGQRTNGDYITVNSMGTASNGSTRSGDWNGYIGSAQGFFVKATQAGTVSFTDAMKVSGNNDDASFFRKVAHNNYQTAKLILTNKTTGAQDETLIGFVENATSGVDLSYDAQKMGRLEGTKLYSLMDDDFPYAIQGLPLATEGIRLGASFDKNAEYVIELIGLNNWPTDLPIGLNDSFENREINLTPATEYVFSASSGITNDRFTLNFTNESILASNQILGLQTNLTINTIEIFKNGEVIDKANVTVMDVSGQVLFSETFNKASGVQQIKYAFSKDRIYLIKIDAEQGSMIKKVLFK